MERLLSPCTRLHDMLESDDRLEEYYWEGFETVKELNLDVSTEDLLSAERALTYADLYVMLGSKNHTVLWLTSHAAVVRADGRGLNYWVQLPESCRRFSFTADGKKNSRLGKLPRASIGDL
jgi:hypothetical protein